MSYFKENINIFIMETCWDNIYPVSFLKDFINLTQLSYLEDTK